MLRPEADLLSHQWKPLYTINSDHKYRITPTLNFYPRKSLADTLMVNQLQNN